MTTEGERLLAGVTVPAVSPMTADGQLDGSGATAFYRALTAAGLRKVLLLGTNGEGPLIPLAGLKASLGLLVESWRRAAGQEAVVTVNVSAPGTLQALERALLARDAGADAVALSPPLYFVHSDREIVLHYAAFDRLGLPVVAYNIPRYANPLTREAAVEVLGMSHVVGIKDSSGDPDLLQHLVAVASEVGDVTVSQGGETQLVAGLQAGAGGIVPGLANVAPVLCIRLFDAWRSGDLSAAQSAQATVTALMRMHSIHRGVASVKQLLAEAGLLAPHVTPPLVSPDGPARHQLREFASGFRDDILHGTAGGGGA